VLHIIDVDIAGVSEIGADVCFFTRMDVYLGSE